MDTQEPLWREQLRGISPAHRSAAFDSLEQHLIEDAGFEPGSPEVLLARLAVGNYGVKSADGSEVQGKPVDLYEAAKYQGIELSDKDVQSVDEALQETLPQVIRAWGVRKKTEMGVMPADAVRRYMNNPKLNHQLLSREEEQELMRAVAQGRELSDKKDPSPRQQAIVRAGKETRDQLVLRNLRFAVHMARKFVDGNVEFEDLLQTANEGLVHAAQEVKPDMEAKFATFAGKVIQHRLANYVSTHGAVIALKKQYYPTMRHVRAEQRLAEELGRMPTAQEMVDNDTTGGLDKEQVEKFRQYAALLRPLELPDNWRQERPLEEKNADYSSRTMPRPPLRPLPETDDVLSAVSAEMLAKDIEKAFFSLSEREEAIIRMRFGMNEEERVCTLREVASVVGLSHARVDQIQYKAMLKIRAYARASELDAYLAD